MRGKASIGCVQPRHARQSFRLNSLFQERRAGQQGSVPQPLPLPPPTREASPPRQTSLCGPEEAQVRTPPSPDAEERDGLKPRMLHDLIVLVRLVRSDSPCTLHAVMVSQVCLSETELLFRMNCTPRLRGLAGNTAL